MPRTSESAVSEIIEVDSSIDLAPFIEAASRLVTKVCTSEDYDDTDLELIERWLAAHFYAVRDPRAKQEGVGAIQVAYERGKTGMGLSATTYGQQAMTLAYSGDLAAWNNRVENGKARSYSVGWLGTSETDDWYGEEF